jgi:hypothetical protein
MSEAPLDSFARELAADVEEVQSDTAEPYSELQVTRLILDEPAERNVFENPIPLTQGGEGRFGRAQYNITASSSRTMRNGSSSPPPSTPGNALRKPCRPPPS